MRWLLAIVLLGVVRGYGADLGPPPAVLRWAGEAAHVSAAEEQTGMCLPGPSLRMSPLSTRSTATSVPRRPAAPAVPLAPDRSNNSRRGEFGLRGVRHLPRTREHSMAPCRWERCPRSNGAPLGAEPDAGTVFCNSL